MPLLFCISEEALIKWIDFGLATSCLTVHHRLPSNLIYADDILIVLEATRPIVRRIKKILVYYGEVSGQVSVLQNPDFFMGTKHPTVSRDMPGIARLLSRVLFHSLI